jgi:hypothetical protein
MALPTAAELLTLDFTYRGEPFCWVEAKALGTESLDYTYRGEPFVATGLGGTAYTLVADAAAFALTGNAAGLLHGRELLADAGAFALTGNAAGLLRAARVAAEAGVFTLTGIDAALHKGFALLAESGVFNLTGHSALFRRSYVIGATVGEFTFTGTDTALKWSGAPVPLIYARIPADAVPLARMARPAATQRQSRPDALSTRRRRN